MSIRPTNSLSGPLRLAISCAVALFAGLAAVFFLRAAAIWLKAGFVTSVFLPICIALSMVLVGVILGRMSDPTPIKYVLIVLLILTVEVSWYCWDYRDFKTQVVQMSASGQITESETADTFLTTEVGSPGFWGYLKWSASRGATIEDGPRIPAGTRAAIVNWGKRLLSLFWALVWAFVGLAQD